MTYKKEEMERTKTFIVIITCFFLCLPSARAEVYDLPEDLPTIEALISLHKLMKAEEDDALARIATSFGEQSLVTKGAKLFNDVRTTLDSKLSNAYSYVVLAGAISSTANSLYRLINDYADFTTNMVETVKKKPMVGWYYTEAMFACDREIKGIKLMYATMTAAGMNVMKASMDEKLEMVFELKTRIDKMRGIIDSAALWCSAVAIGDFGHDYIWDSLNSEVLDKIAEGVINNWLST